MRIEFRIKLQFFYWHLESLESAAVAVVVSYVEWQIFLASAWVAHNQIKLEHVLLMINHFDVTIQYEKFNLATFRFISNSTLRAVVRATSGTSEIANSRVQANCCYTTLLARNHSKESSFSQTKLLYCCWNRHSNDEGSTLEREQRQVSIHVIDFRRERERERESLNGKKTVFWLPQFHLNIRLWYLRYLIFIKFQVPIVPRVLWVPSRLLSTQLETTRRRKRSFLLVRKHQDEKILVNILLSSSLPLPPVSNHLRYQCVSRM